MKHKALWLKFVSGLVVGSALSYGAWSGYKIVVTASGYKAKMLCSAVFVSKRNPKSVLLEDLGSGGQELLKQFQSGINRARPSVSAAFRGYAIRRAEYRDGMGCTLNYPDTSGFPDKMSPVSFPKIDANLLWPQGRKVDLSDAPPGFNGQKLREAIDEAFAEPEGGHGRNTRAVVIVHKGRIVFERYAPTFRPGMPLLGWSMSKSVWAALVGILVKDGRLSLHSHDLLAEWRGDEDKRGEITIEHLLHMSSGLDFTEKYSSPLSDIVQMLFAVPGAANFAATRSLSTPPGEHWRYSSGTTNILSKIVRNAYSGSHADYLSFPRRRLFGPLGMTSAMIEPDGEGTFIGSSFMYASPRDWARFGLFLAQGGKWNAKSILPIGWTDYMRRPAPASRDKSYGAHLWLKLPENRRSATPPPRSLPADAFHMLGFEGQSVSVMPSKELVIVRLGLTRPPARFDLERFLGNVIEALEPRKDQLTGNKVQ